VPHAEHVSRLPGALRPACCGAARGAGCSAESAGAAPGGTLEPEVPGPAPGAAPPAAPQRKHTGSRPGASAAGRVRASTAARSARSCAVPGVGAGPPRAGVTHLKGVHLWAC